MADLKLDDIDLRDRWTLWRLAQRDESTHASPQMHSIRATYARLHQAGLIAYRHTPNGRKTYVRVTDKGRAYVPLVKEWLDLRQARAERITRLQDDQERIERAGPSLLKAAKAALPILKQYIEEAGPCDHSVGVCVCGVVSVAGQMQDAIAEAEGKPKQEEHDA